MATTYTLNIFSMGLFHPCLHVIRLSFLFHYPFNVAVQRFLLKLEAKALIHYILYTNYCLELPLNASNLNSSSDISKAKQCHLSLKDKINTYSVI